MNRTLDDLGISMLPTLRRHGVVRAGVFGSHARGEAGRDSDFDLLVAFEEGRSLFDLVDLRDELSTLLGQQADVVTYKSLHAGMREQVLREEVRIL